MSLPTLTVVIPTLNEAARIGDLLRALQGQSVGAQIIVADGESNDQTARVVAAFEGVELLRCARGVSKQRNAGARAANGELLIFLDADDVPPPQFLENVARAYAKMPFAIACPWFVAHDGNWATKAIYAGFNVGFWLGQSTLRLGSGVCLIAPRADFLGCGGFDETLHLGEDVQLIRKLCPRFGLHRQLLVPLGTSGRRFEHEGAAKLLWFYACITPLLVLGLWRPLQKIGYAAAPYGEESHGDAPNPNLDATLPDQMPNRTSGTARDKAN